MDDNVAIMGDWIPPSPSPRTFFSSVLGEELGSRSVHESLPQNDAEGRFSGSKEMISLGDSDNKDSGQLEDRSNQFTDLGSFSDLKSNSRGGLVERMAARAGFNAPRLNTEGIRPNDVLNSDSRSPLLMISPGLSPTTLLESPVFLSNSLAQPSPTTGKFPLFPPNGSNRSSKSTLGAPETDTCRGYLAKDIGSASFAFKPTAEPSPSFFVGGSKGNESLFPQQSLSFPRIDNSTQSENSISLQPHNAEPSKMQPPRMFEGVPEHGSPPLDEPMDEEGGDQKGNGDSVGGGGGAPSDDGYNWRKYGQKQVKGSEYPRSYYKCTHPNCPVKKKVERSHEGHITEIIYKGAHNHPKPPPNRRAANPEQGSGPYGPTDGEAGWNNVQRRSSGSEWKQDNFEVTSSPSEGHDFGNQGGAGLHAQNGSGQLEGGGDPVDASSTFSNEEAEDDQGTNGSVSLGNDAEGDESESKRRKIEVYPADMSGNTRAIREPRVVVQTTSEVDILDDGYRWRKYGQKVVKGNPNPRSYYKCTSPGCTVRKHVERASHDLKSVITTYEGKHNHDVPAARNSSHGNTGTSGSAQPVQAHAHRPEPSLAHVMPRFDGSGHLSPFGLPGRPLQLGHGVSFGMGAPSLANFGLAGLGHVHGKMPVHPFLAQQRHINDMSFVMQQKGEAKAEPGAEPGLNLSNNSSSVYQQLMSRLPLGPQM